MVGGTWDGNVLNNGTPLLAKLNGAVSGEQSKWKRTTAGRFSMNGVTFYGNSINDDYPVLFYDGYTCLNC